MMILYIIAAICWALYAIEMQKKVHGKYPEAVTQKRLVFVFMINVIFCPICIGIAYYKLYKQN